MDSKILGGRGDRDDILQRAQLALNSQRPQEALTEYEISLRTDPNRFNGLYNAGAAAEAAGDKRAAAEYYAALLKSTGNGATSSRPEMAHAKSFVESEQVAAK